MEFWIFTQQDLFFLRSALDLALLSSRLPEGRSGAEAGLRRACVLGAVMCSASFLECSINGLYDYAHSPSRKTKLHRALVGVWSRAFGRQPMLAKYQIALALAKREPFLTGAEPYQSADALVELRNVIAHPKELIETPSRHRRLEARLGQMFDLNPRRQHHREFLPDRCLSPDCAFWAVESAATFFVKFRDRMPPTAYMLDAGCVSALLQEAKEARDRLKS